MLRFSQCERHVLRRNRYIIVFRATKALSRARGDSTSIKAFMRCESLHNCRIYTPFGLLRSSLSASRTALGIPEPAHPGTDRSWRVGYLAYWSLGRLGRPHLLFASPQEDSLIPSFLWYDTVCRSLRAVHVCVSPSNRAQSSIAVICPYKLDMPIQIGKYRFPCSNVVFKSQASRLESPIGGVSPSPFLTQAPLQAC